MKYLILIVTSILLFSCKSVEEPTFVFKDNNEITFYRVRENSENLFAQDSVEVPKFFEELLFTSVPTNLPTENEIKEIEKYYKKVALDKKSTIKLTAIFNEAGFPINTANFATVKICAPVYRDILIFKEDGKVNAFAKICLSCYKNHIIIEKNQFSNAQIKYKELHKLLDSLASH
ncbi:hypothetical protein [Flavobacterium sp.]|uniref:hypothetical protein n=1 Tax=Flavobacterium sp. TaxID=239 RepID=UPI0026178DC8|nr:hypothetical protein [Flavobacterium sp.]